jgi:hypothetical protein
MRHEQRAARHSRTLAQKGGFALDAQAGERRLREVLNQAGFMNIRRVAETPLNLVLEARP